MLWRHATGEIALDKPRILGVVNVTPDSFSDGGRLQSIDDARRLMDRLVAEGADVLVIVNPLVPLRVGDGGAGLRERGLLTIINQAIRIGAVRALRDQMRGAEAQGKAVLTIEPEPAESLLFFGNPASFDVRRRILEYAYRHARALITAAAEAGHPALARTGWVLRPSRSEPSRPVQAPA